MAALHGERSRAVLRVLGTHSNPLGTVPAGVRLEIPVEFSGAQIAASDAARNLGDVEVELHAGLQLEWYLFRGALHSTHTASHSFLTTEETGDNLRLSSHQAASRARGIHTSTPGHSSC